MLCYCRVKRALVKAGIVIVLSSWKIRRRSASLPSQDVRRSFLNDVGTWPEIADGLAGGCWEASGESSQSRARLRRMASCANHVVGVAVAPA